MMDEVGFREAPVTALGRSGSGASRRAIKTSAIRLRDETARPRQHRPLSQNPPPTNKSSSILIARCMSASRSANRWLLLDLVPQKSIRELLQTTVPKEQGNGWDLHRASISANTSAILL